LSIRGAKGSELLAFQTDRRSSTQQLSDLGPKLKQLLTRHYKTTVSSGGGRSGTGTSTFFESHDGRFSTRSGLHR